MSLGPVEWIAIAFPGSTISREVVPAIAKLVDSGTIHIIDILIIHKDADGAVTAEELGDLSPAELAAFDAVEGDVMSLLSEEDFPIVAEELEPDSTALVVLWENLWAIEFADAARASNGVLLTHDRIPREIVDKALEAALAYEGTNS
jgi:hypothetical protein